MPGSRKEDLRTLYDSLCRSAGVKPVAKNDSERFAAIRKLFAEQKKSIREKDYLCQQINNRINDILEVITSLASLDYSRKAKVTGSGDHVDALAVGINMLAEEMEQSTISLSEKEILLKEIHHRVKNNLQLVCSLLNIQSSYITDPGSLRLFRESQNRVNSLSLIHEKLYTSKDFSKINFSEYITSIANYLSAVYNINPERIEVITDINTESGYLPLDTALPCGLIVNELLSNCFKYAFPGDMKGRIEMKLIRKADKNKTRFVLQVKDNGVGLPSGMNIFKTETLGLQLVTTLVEQIEGSLITESKAGTLFRISFYS